MKLFLMYRCPFGHRASFAIQEKGLAFEPVFFAPGKRPAELEALGPHAKSPTVIDGDAKVWDSQVVLEYLEDRYPTPRLLPADAAARAEVRMLAARIGSELGSKQGGIAMELVMKPPDQRDLGKVETLKRQFVDALAPWDERLAGRAFLFGDALGLADVTLFTLFPAIEQLAGVTIPEERKHLRAWYERMSSRPASKLLAPG